MFQNWESLTFVHWRANPVEFQRHLPPGLQLDTFDGEAWVSLTPFQLTGLRPPFVPAVPYVSRFLEMNLRTYVRGPDGEPGVWFLSLEASRMAAVIGARLGYRLPYHWARMRLRHKTGEVEYSSRRHFANAGAKIKVRPGDAIVADERENFLTARFLLYTVFAGRLASARIEHEPWPLQSAEAVELRENMLERYGLRPIGAPLIHYSRGVHTRVARPRFCPKT